MSIAKLEIHQVWLYLAAVSVGVVMGSLSPRIAQWGDLLVWPLLAALLLATFLLLPVANVRRALADRRFASAVLAGNFVVLPIIVGILVLLLPDHPPLRLGVMLVLLAPCIDWFVTFAQLGRGDGARALTVTPLNVLGQAVLLPLALWWVGPAMLPLVSAYAFGLVTLVVVLPLFAAIGLDRWITAAPTHRTALRTRAGHWPIPLLAGVLGCIAAAHADALTTALIDAVAVGLVDALGVFIAFLILAVVVARVMATAWRLPPAQGRTLAFSFGTRNSFIILPWVLALPAGWEMAAVVVVMQSLVELLGMIVYLWLIPRKVFPD